MSRNFGLDSEALVLRLEPATVVQIAALPNPGWPTRIHISTLRIMNAVETVSRSPSETSSDTDTTFSLNSYKETSLEDASLHPHSSPSAAQLLPISTSTPITHSPPGPPRSLPSNSRIPYLRRLAIWTWLVLSSASLLGAIIVYCTFKCPKTGETDSASHSAIPKGHCVPNRTLSQESIVAWLIFLGLFVGAPFLVISFIVPCFRVVRYIYRAFRGPASETSPSCPRPTPILRRSKLGVDDEESRFSDVKL